MKTLSFVQDANYITAIIREVNGNIWWQGTGRSIASLRKEVRNLFQDDEFQIIQ